MNRPLPIEKHTLFRMKMTIKDDGKFEVDQIEHQQEAIEMIDEKLSKEYNYYWWFCGHLYNKRFLKQLSEQKSKILYSINQKLLYIIQRGRPDLETDITLLYRRVHMSI